MVHGETAWRMLTLHDQYVNMLRATTATFSAAVGGADSIAVLPHSWCRAFRNNFGRRVARNTQLVLMEESNLYKVADPAAGSGAIEARIEALGAKAWELFGSIEAQGGLKTAVKNGDVARWLGEARTVRAAAIASGKRKLTAVTAFPLLDEAAPDIDGSPLPVPPPRDGGLPAPRLAEPFEALRLAADAREETGQPDVFLAMIGNQAGFGPRATWAKAFFEAGGLRLAAGEGGNDPSAIAAAFAESGAAAACLVGTDDSYAELAGILVLTLVEAGARTVWLAGRPERVEGHETWSSAVEPVFEGSEMLAILQSAHKRLNIAPLSAD